MITLRIVSTDMAMKMYLFWTLFITYQSTDMLKPAIPNEINWA